jgi:hypothetical protein
MATFSCLSMSNSRPPRYSRNKAKSKAPFGETRIQPYLRVTIRSYRKLLMINSGLLTAIAAYVACFCWDGSKWQRGASPGPPFLR